MQITGTIPKNSNFFTAVKSKPDVQDFNIPEETERKSFGVSDKQILDCYEKICKAYPSVAFKMSDIETGKNGSAPYYIGYKGDSHQRGDNYSCPGQCSIQIDVEVLRRMAEDEEYSAQVYGTIQNAVLDYQGWAKQGENEGFEYCYMGISHEDGRLTRFVGFSHFKASTDEEIREMWKDAFISDDSLSEVKISYEKLLNKTRNEMQETFFAIFDEAQQRRDKIFQ